MDEGILPEQFRLFIAITVPDPIKERIKTTQDQLRQSLRRGPVRWTKPDQFHLTLRFLGNIKEPSVEPLIDAVRTVCQSVYPLELRASGLGFFPNARAPRVIWVGVQDRDGRLVPTQQAVQQATLRFTSEKADERFSGHVTLGRMKNLRRQETEILARAAERFSGRLFGEWKAQEIHFMRSQLSAQGADHTVLAAVHFS